LFGGGSTQKGLAAHHAAAQKETCRAEVQLGKVVWGHMQKELNTNRPPGGMQPKAAWGQVMCWLGGFLGQIPIQLRRTSPFSGRSETRWVRDLGRGTKISRRELGEPNGQGYRIKQKNPGGGRWGHFTSNHSENPTGPPLFITKTYGVHLSVGCPVRVGFPGRNGRGRVLGFSENWGPVALFFHTCKGPGPWVVPKKKS